MNSQILQAELSNLIQESKRKHSDLRNAAEQSLTELRSLASTSEAQLAADLIRRPHFVKPFVLACLTRHGKLPAIGAGCIHKLVAARALPPERLGDVLEGLNETTGLSLDVQLKALQTLPSLFQHYADALSGELLARTLEICATLQNSKTVAVSNTAAATLQQLVVSIFERVAKEDDLPDDIAISATVSVDEQEIEISASAHDALRIFEDLCLLVEGGKPLFLGVKSLSKIFVLELIESIISSHHDVFLRHSEQADILRRRLMPLTLRYISERHSFSITVRVARILLLLLRFHLSLLTAECDMALSLLTHLLDTDASTSWKRALCLEIFRSLYSEPGLIRHIFSMFDEQEGRRNIVRDHMACLARLASEKPSLIGVSHQSSIPIAPTKSNDTIEDQVALEAVGVAGVIGSPATETSAYGISSQWSLVRIPYLDTLDKVDNPSPPETYIYSLVLNCISAFSEGIAKFILPLTASETKTKRSRPISTAAKDGQLATDRQEGREANGVSRMFSVPLNPLELENHPQIAAIKATAGMIDACWPAVLAICSTFLYAALDGGFYHNLVRAFQKLAHVAGLLRLSTPRDAFLTTLGKAAIPSDLFNAAPSGPTTPAAEAPHNLRPDSSAGKSPAVPEFAHRPADNSLTSRNLLCLRALLNLGISLGPALDQASWSIVLESLQHAELILNLSSPLPPAATSAQASETPTDHEVESLRTNVPAEVMAVQTAANKMFACTAEYPDNAFETILVALLGLSEETDKSLTDHVTLKTPPTPSHAQGVRLIPQTKRSISIGRGKGRIKDDQLRFVLSKLNDLARANLKRLALLPEEERIWKPLINSLVAVSGDEGIPQGLRLKAADVLDKAVFSTIKLGSAAGPPSANYIQLRGLKALKLQISTLYNERRPPNSAMRTADIEVHDLALETLKSVLEDCGEAVTEGWALIFDLISSVFDRTTASPSDDAQLDSSPFAKASTTVVVKSPRLIRTAYDSLQLVASDFLSLVPSSCLLEMVECFSSFAAQKDDFNISLTTTTHIWNICDFLRNRMSSWSLGPDIDISSTEQALIAKGKDSDVGISRNALWLLLLLRIADLSVDSRGEIRNSAVQTLLRIMDQHGDQLPPDAWHLCLNRVLFVMAEAIQQRTLETIKTGTSSNQEEQKSWVDTTVVVTKGLSDLIATYFSSIIRHGGFDLSWTRLLRCFGAVAASGSLELSQTSFSNFSKVLSRIRTTGDVGLRLMKDAWDIWVRHHPVPEGGPVAAESSNQEALQEYVRCFKQLYRLLKDDLSQGDVVDVLEKFRVSVWESIISRYSPDLERESELQTLVLECLRDLCSEIPASQPAILKCLAEFSDSPFTKRLPEHDKSRPTFVAFSKSTMRLLSWYIGEYGIRTDVITDGTLNRVLEHLSNPMLNKYSWPGKDSAPFLWQVATTSALDILQTAIPYVEERYAKAEQSMVAHFWRCVVNIVRGVVIVIGKDCNLQGANVLEDETFDIAAFQRLRAMIVPSLGSPYVPEKVRCEFGCTLFRSSLIYPPQRMDLPDAGIDKEPLKNLYRVKMGRTFDPAPNPRSKLSYVLIDTLFDLVSVRPAATGADKHAANSAGLPANGVTASAASQSRTLAKSTSPYLILRSAISLKSYIADQPLRGLMPQPMIARTELLYILRRLVELRSEPAAIPPAGPTVPLGSRGGGKDEHGNASDCQEYKKHLGWMYPLIIRAVKVAGKETEDSRVLDALTRILDEVAGDGETDEE